MNLVYKVMEQDDYEKCAKVFMKAFKGEPWNEDWSFEQAYSRINEIMSSRVSRGYVIYYGDEVVSMLCGRIMTYLDSKEFWIDELSVNPDYQGKSIGSKMLDYIKDNLKKEEIFNICLLTKKGFPSVKFYEKKGLKQEDTIIFMHGEI